MEGSKKGSAKEEDMWHPNKMEADYAKYLMRKYFSGKDIFGEDIFKETVNIRGMNIKASRLSPTLSYADPVAYTKEEKKSVEEHRLIPSKPFGEPAMHQVGSSCARDESEKSSDSLQEIPVDAWKEVQSAMKRAKFDAGLSKKCG